MDALTVTMDIGSEQVLVNGHENVALGLEITNPESYATPIKLNLNWNIKPGVRT